ncbi:MAG TPA: branched-chain amino acid ABC transporter permease [Actinomycetes bacterium]|nr:branched-chain amino acid ABC transporter permease [Actinomycetes bacterium]
MLRTTAWLALGSRLVSNRPVSRTTRGSPRVVHWSVARFLAVLIAGVGLLAGGVATAGAASAAPDDEPTGLIQGFLRSLSGDPVAGVDVTATNAEGFSGTGTSDETGRWEIEVPGEGMYDVELDVDTLPDGVAEPTTNPLTVTVFPGSPRTILFRLGEHERDIASKWDQAAQLTVEGLRFGLIIALAAVGLSLIYGTTGLTNFAHGEIVTFGAIITWWFNSSLGLPLILAAVLGIAMSGLFGFVNDRGLWKPLRKRQTGLIAMMIVSIGLALALQNIYLIIFGGASRPFTDFQTQAGIEFGPVSLTPKDLVAMGIAITVLTLAGLALLKTRIGKATRAVSDNPALAASSGIDVERVILVVWVVGAALAGLGGILQALTQQVFPLLGAQSLLLIFAAVTLGGLGTAFGALVGSLVVGLFINLSTLIPGVTPELKNVGALLVLIIVLMFRPQGILGRRSRVG